MSKISMKRDRKASVPMWIITREDEEGFHRQLNMTAGELDELFMLWRAEKNENV